MFHDRHFKNLFAKFLQEFIELFFPEWYPQLDCSSVVWLQNEQFNKQHDGPIMWVDLVGLVKTKPACLDYETTPQVAIHIEFESGDSQKSINERMIHYQGFLINELRMPILSIVLFQKMCLEGIGVNTTTNSFRPVTFMKMNIPYVAIGGLVGQTYLEGDNILGVALSPLMRWPKEKMVYANAEAMRKIAESNVPDEEKQVLFSFVEAYQDFDEEQQSEYDAILEQNDYKKVGHMRQTSLEIGEEIGLKKGEAIGIQKGEAIGIQKGRQEGRQGTLRSVVLKLGTKKYGNPTADDLEQLIAISDVDRLNTMFDRIDTASSWSELLK